MRKQLSRLDRYEILQEIRSGGLAVVYQARDPNLDRVVALKALHPAHSHKVRRRFVCQARRAARLRHNNIVCILDVGERQGQPYVAMDYLPGGNLAQRLRQGPLSPETALRILEQLASALDHAHARDLVHGDVKPANVLFDEDDNAVLCDFGLAGSLLESGLMANLSPASDVYALGVVAYEMLAGRTPFEGGDTMPPPNPRELNPALDEALAQALLEALHKSPAQRPASAGAFVRSLRAVRSNFASASRGTRPATLDQAPDCAALPEQAPQEASKKVWYGMATPSLERDRCDAAWRDLLQLLNRDPVYQNVASCLRSGRGGALGQHGGLADKIQDLELELDEARLLATVLERASHALKYYNVLLRAFETNDWERAIKVGERLVQLAPDLTRPRTWLAYPRDQLESQAAQDRDCMVWEQDGKEMLRIPAGEFLYGDQKLTLELPEFWIDKTPVTNAEYSLFVAATGQAPPLHWRGQAPPQEISDHPVIQVSWHDAAAYARWAGKRLPAEQEWEKAARGVDGRAYPWGDDEPTPELCNFGFNEGGTTPVGQYSSQFYPELAEGGDSPYGCVDMAGNVWEWTASDYGKKRKVMRGGSWDNIPGNIRVANRNYQFAPDDRYDCVGLRCVVRPGGGG
jgi:hypothetical protein